VKIIEKISLKAVSRVTYILIMMIMMLNLVVLGFLPVIVGKIFMYDIGIGYLSIVNYRSIYYYFLLVLYLSGGIAFIFLNDLRLIFYSCLNENVFIKENVKRLLRMAVCTFAIASIFLTKIFVVNSFMTMLVVMVFFMAAAFCLVLTLVFDQAVQYKLENDLTI